MRVKKPICALVIAVVLAVPPALSTMAAAADVPVPDGYRMDLYRSPTPAVLPGAATVEADAVARLAAAGAVLIDVLPATVTRLRADGPAWIPTTEHRNLPASVWLPNVGEGRLGAGMEDWYRLWLERLTGGDRARALVLYCKADCWLSWNAARRALTYGYTAVHWFRDGVEAWEESGRELVPSHPAGPPPVELE